MEPQLELSIVNQLFRSQLSREARRLLPDDSGLFGALPRPRQDGGAGQGDARGAPVPRASGPGGAVASRFVLPSDRDGTGGAIGKDRHRISGGVSEGRRRHRATWRHLKPQSPVEVCPAPA